MKQKNKNIILVVLFVFILMLVYKLSITKTIALNNDVENLQKEYSVAQNLTSSFAILNQKERALDSIIKTQNIKDGSVQNNLLEIIQSTSKNNEITISEFNEPHLFTEDNQTIESYSFKLKGLFDDLQEVIYTLEQKYTIGSIKHFRFEKKKDFRQNRNYLECFIVLSRVVSKK